MQFLRVIIVGHIPFGLNDFDATFGWVSNYTDTYLGLLKQVISPPPSPERL